MLQKVPPIAVPFVGGLDTKADSKMTPMGSFQVLENAVFTEHGSIKKRWGYDAKKPVAMDGSQFRSYYGGSQLSYSHLPIDLSSWNGALLAGTDNDLFSWSDSADRWVTHGFCPAISVSTEPVPSITGEQQMGDSISNGILTAYIWQDSRDSTSVRASIVDAVTGFVYVHDYSLDTNGRIPRCGLVDGRIILIWLDGTANTIESVAISNTDPEGSIAATPGTIESSISSSDVYDVVVSGDKTWLAVMTTDLEIHEIGIDGLSYLNVSRDVATEFTITAANISVISIAHVYGADGPDGTMLLNIVGCTSAGASGFWVKQNDGDLTAGTGAAFSCTTSGTVNNLSLVQTLGESTTTETPTVVYEIDHASAWNTKVVFEDADGGVTKTVLHAGLASRGALIGDSGHVVLNYTSPGLQHCYVLHSIAGGPVARFAYGDAGAAFSNGQLPALHSSDAVNFNFAALMRRRISTLGQAFESEGSGDPSAGASTSPSDIATFENTEIAKYVFTYGLATRSAEVGSSTYLVKGALRTFTGATCEESAPLLFPEDVTIEDEGETGSQLLPADGTYLYRVYYERVRPNNELTRSLSLTFKYTVGATAATASLTLPTLTHTMMEADGDWRIAVYRTEANKTDLFYLVTNPDLTVSTGVNRYVANETDVNDVNLLDDMLDADLIKNKICPQSQGVLPVVQPAPGTIIGEANDRLFLAGGEYDTGVIGPSLLIFPGEPVLFSDELRFSVEEEGGEIEAMGALDGVLVVFKERRVYAVSGQGPSDAGGGQDFNVQRVTTDVGCTQPGSVVETPEGLMFQSAKGLYIINRSFDTEYIGWPVETFNEQCIVSAEVIPNSNIVVFLTSSGQSLSYDYFFKQWSSWTGHAGLDAINIGNDYHYLRSDGKVRTRNEDAYLDDGQWYSMRLRTAPIRLDSIQDYMRVRRLNIVGEYLSSHRLQMKVFNNRDPFPFETRIFEPDDVIDLELWGDADVELWGDADLELWGGTPGDTDYQFQHKFKRQKVQYLRLEFQDLQTGAAPGQSYELAEMNFDIGVYDRNARIPAGRKL